MNNQKSYTAEEIKNLTFKQPIGDIVIGPVIESGKPILVITQHTPKGVSGVCLSTHLAEQAAIAIALFLEQHGSQKNN